MPFVVKVMVKVISNVKCFTLTKSIIKIGVPFDKSNVTSFDLRDHGQGRGQGNHWIARKNPESLAFFFHV